MFRRITLTLALLTAAMSLMAQDRYVELSAKNFPDAEFRNFLKTKFAANVSNNKLDIAAVNEINLNFVDGSVKYTKIKSLEGIKLLTNLYTLILPATYNTKTYALGDIDVSGMESLTTVTNGVKNSTWSTPYAVNGYGIVTAQSLKVAKNSMTKFTAIDCPNLTDINLAGYKSLKSIELGGGTLNAITNLYVCHTGLEKLDISQMPNLFNHVWVAGTDYYWTKYDVITDANQSMDENYSSFSVDHCENLTEFIIGEHPFKAICISGATKLKSIDLSGLPDLVRFHADFVPSNKSCTYGSDATRSKYNCNHQYTQNVKGALEEVIIGPGHKHFRYFMCKGANLTNAKVDFENLASTIIDINVESNKLTSLDVQSFPNLETCDVKYNRIHRLGVFQNEGLSSIDIADNCLTWIDQFSDGEFPYYPELEHTTMFQYIRKGGAYRYKVLENAKDAKYIETSDDTNSQKYYWNMHGGHLGNPANDEKMFGETPTGRKEDPRYFYFDSPLTDGVYWYRNPYHKISFNKENVNTHSQYGWMKVNLCISDDVDFNPDKEKFYLVGEFNNWTPTEDHAFVLNPDNGLYELQLGEPEALQGTFRVWNHNDPKEVYLDFGGHSSEEAGTDNHIYFKEEDHHKMATNPAVHYTTNHADPTKSLVYTGSKVQMSLVPGAGDSNWIAISGGTVTGIDGIIIDRPAEEGPAAPVEYYDLQGRRLATPAAPGLYIRRQGRSITKVTL